MSVNRPSDDTSGSNIDVCDEIVCRMTTRIKPNQMILEPCSDYTVRVGSTNLTLTTFPGTVIFKNKKLICRKFSNLEKIWF